MATRFQSRRLNNTQPESEDVTLSSSTTTFLIPKIDDLKSRFSSSFEETELYTISIAGRYGLFVGGLGLLTALPYDFRGPYLWGTTFALTLYSMFKGEMTPHLFMTVAGGIIHSAIHLIWPFLDDVVGFNPEVSALPDVFFHTIMLVFMWYSMKKDLQPAVNYFTMFCIAGAFLNCVFTGFKTTQKDSYAELLLSDVFYAIFVITTVFQAISTAYWIACVLHYKEWHDIRFVYGLFTCVTVIVSNWFWYHMDDILQLGIGLVRLSMLFRYIEALFIICTWVPLSFTKPAAVVEKKKQM